MILPIVAYGTPVLKKEANSITKDYPELSTLIQNMFETMENAQGVGLAAPQIGLSIRLFLVDATPFAEDDEKGEYQHLKEFKKIFINPTILDYKGEKWGYEEGCLSIPTVRAEVQRPEEITIEYYDETL